MTRRNKLAPKTLAEYLRSGAETQARLARRAAVSQSQISRVASGQACSLALAKRLAALTGVPLSTFGGEAQS